MNKRVRVGDLHHIAAILDIRPINDLTVSHYRQNLREGVKFPDIIVRDRKGKLEIISGYRRQAAYLAEFGEDYEINVDVRHYEALVDVIEFAVKDNLTHGEQLDGITRKRAVCKLIELGRDPEAVAKLMGVSIDRIVSMAGESVCIRKGSRRVHVPVKRGVEHLHGTVVSRRAYVEHIQQDMGKSVRQLAGQITRHIKRGWVNIADERTIAALEELRDAIDTLTAKK